LNQRYFSHGLLLLVLLSVIVLPGCGGGGGDDKKPDNTPASLDVNPATLSMEFGQVVQLNAAPKNAAGEVLLQTVTYSSDNTSVVTVSGSGNVCAGTWDAAFVVCTPGTTAASANIIAKVGNVTKSVPVKVHRRIASVQISSTGVPCTSSTKTQQFTARAFASDGTEITSTVGPASWGSSLLEVATLDANGLATAKKPGRSQITAVINNVLSLPASMTTCPPASITIKETGSNPPVTSFTLDSAGTKTLAATVVDTLGQAITDITLTYSTSQSAVATVNNSGSVVAFGAGKAGIVASCTPPSCNPGLNTPVYSNLVNVSVNGTSTTNAYVTGKTATTLIPIDLATNTAGTAINIPTVTVNNAAVNPVINSFMFNHNGNLAFLGTDRGMLTFNANTSAISNNTALAGKVLAISPDDNKVIVAATDRVFVYDTAGNTHTTLGVPGATAAYYSPDNMKAYIVAGTTTFVFELGALRTLPVASAGTDVTILTQGNYAYIAGETGNAISVRSTCDNNQLVSVPTAAKPLLIESTHDSTHVYATDGANMYDISVTTAEAPCPPPNPVQSLTTTAYGATVTPKQLLVKQDGTKTYLLNNSPQILVYGPASGVSTFTMAASSTEATTGGLTLDGRFLVVGALGANNVQKFDTATGLVTPIAVNLRDKDNNVVAPDFVVVRTK